MSRVSVAARHYTCKLRHKNISIIFCQRLSSVRWPQRHLLIDSSNCFKHVKSCKGIDILCFIRTGKEQCAPSNCSAFNTISCAILASWNSSIGMSYKNIFNWFRNQVLDRKPNYKLIVFEIPVTIIWFQFILTVWLKFEVVDCSVILNVILNNNCLSIFYATTWIQLTFSNPWRQLKFWVFEQDLNKRWDEKSIWYRFQLSWFRLKCPLFWDVR